MAFNPEKIIFEDNHLLVVEKGPGMLSQEDASGYPDLLNELKSYIKIRDDKPGNVYLGLVHRLDRNTGGVMCFAKTSKAAARLSEQVRKKQWDKYYLSLSETRREFDGKQSWQTLEDKIAKDEETNVSSISDSGKLSLLESRILGQIEYNGRYLNLRENKLITGRSHQIRVQLSARREAILGDYKYGARRNNNLDQFFLGLWANRLEINHPISKERMSFESYPQDYAIWNMFDFDIKKRD